MKTGCGKGVRAKQDRWWRAKDSISPHMRPVMSVAFYEATRADLCRYFWMTGPQLVECEHHFRESRKLFFCCR